MSVPCNTTLLGFSLNQIRMKYPISTLSLHFWILTHGLDDGQYERGQSIGASFYQNKSSELGSVLVYAEPDPWKSRAEYRVDGAP